jgi:hypothetical protein
VPAGRDAHLVPGVCRPLTGRTTTSPSATKPTRPTGTEASGRRHSSNGNISSPELVGMLARPGEFIASANDFAGHLLTSQVKYTERMTEAIKPLLGAATGAAPSKDHIK